MKMGDQNMDDLFRKAADSQHANYRTDFWKDMESQLADDALDTAFRNAASGNSFALPENLSESLNDAFMDDAFKTASDNTHIPYFSAYWTEFAANRSIIEENISFVEAANALQADYHPTYWEAADVALQNEGLHYEYRTEYWSEARRMLDRADRSKFFIKWSAVAVILLLLSFGGIFMNNKSGRMDTVLQDNSAHTNTQGSSVLALAESLHENNNSINHAGISNHETVDFTTESTDNKSGTELRPSDNHSNISYAHTTDLNSQGLSSPNDVNNGSNEVSDITSPRDVNFVDSDSPELIEEQDNYSTLASQVETLASIDNRDNLKKLPLTAIPSNSNIDLSYSGPEIEVHRAVSRPTSQFYLFANSGFGNKYGQPNFIPTWRTGGGIEYTHTSFGRLRNFEFGGTLGINHIRQNDFGTERRVSVYNTKGGVDKFWYKLQLKDMIYTNVSAVVGYRIDHLQKIRFSVGADYLVFVQSNMSYQNQPDMGITTVNNNWGVKEGVSKLDLRLGLGYEIQVGKRWSFQANGSFGLFDRSDDDFIIDKNFDHEMNATVGVKYTLLRKP